jgi:G:T/U-mismatch repair DNA glycosylase
MSLRLPYYVEILLKACKKINLIFIKKCLAISFLIMLLMLSEYLLVIPDFSILIFVNILLIGIGIISWIFWDSFTVKIISILLLRKKVNLSLGISSDFIFDKWSFSKRTIYPLGFVFSICILKWEFTEIPGMINIFWDFILFALLLPLSIFIVPTKWVLDEAKIFHSDKSTKMKKMVAIPTHLEHFVGFGAVLSFFIFVLDIWKKQGFYGIIGSLMIFFFVLGIPSVTTVILYGRFSYKKHIENVRMLIEEKKYKLSKRPSDNPRIWKYALFLIFLLYAVLIGLFLLDLPFFEPNSTGTRRYTNSQYGFSFEYPNSWRELTPKEAKNDIENPGINLISNADSTIAKGKVVELIEKAQLIDVYIEIIEGINQTDKSLQQSINYQDTMYYRSIPGFKKISDKVITINKVKGIEYTYTFRQSFWTYEAKKIFLYRNDKIYIISFIALSSDFDDYYNNYFIPLINSFKIEQIIFNSQKLSTKTTWSLGNGYSITVQDIDVSNYPKQVWLVFSHSDKRLDGRLVAEGDQYNYNNIFTTTVYRIEEKGYNKYVTLTDTFLEPALSAKTTPPINAEDKSNTKVLIEINKVPTVIEVENEPEVYNLDTKILEPDESWDISEGYVLTANSIDARSIPGRAWLALSRNGVKLEDIFVKEGETYEYNNVLSTRVESIISEFVYVRAKNHIIGSASERIQLEDTQFHSTNIPVTPESPLTRYDVKTLFIGEPWELDGGYVLTENSIDARSNTRKAWLALSRNGVKLEDIFVKEGETYNYSNILNFKINIIFSGSTNDMTQLKDIQFHPTNIPVTPESPPAKSDVKILTAGERWELDKVYSLTVNSIDIQSTPRRAWLTLFRDGIRLEDIFVKEEDTYDYNNILNFKINIIFSGPATDMIQLKDIQFHSTNIPVIPESPPTQYDVKTLSLGEPWELDEGYVLTTNSIDGESNPRKAWISIYKNKVKLEDMFVREGETYDYNNILNFKINTIFSGLLTDVIQLKDTQIHPTNIPVTPESSPIQHDVKILQLGEPWELDEGYVLKANSIDAKSSPERVWLVLYKNENKLDSELLSEGEIYNYNNGFNFKVDTIFSGIVGDLVVFSAESKDHNSPSINSSLNVGRNYEHNKISGFEAFFAGFGVIMALVLRRR